MSKITENELKKKIGDQNFSGFYLLYGDEKYLVSYYTKKIVESIVGTKYNDFNFQVFNKDKIDINDILSSVESVPLMSNKKCVLINDLDLSLLNDNDRNSFIKLISDLPETTVLIMSYPTLEIDLKKNTKWKKFISSADEFGTILEFEKRGLQALERQLVSWAKKRGTVLSLLNASKIIMLCGDDLHTLSLEIEKLCAYVDYKEITEDDIETIVAKNLETTVFALSNALARRDYEKAFRQLDLLFYQREEPISVLAVLSSVFIDMYRVRVSLESGKDPCELTKYFDYKNKAFKLKNAQRDSKKITTDNIKKCLNILSETDMLLKNTRADKRVVMEELISKIMLTL